MAIRGKKSSNFCKSVQKYSIGLEESIEKIIYWPEWILQLRWDEAQTDVTSLQCLPMNQVVVWQIASQMAANIVEFCLVALCRHIFKANGKSNLPFAILLLIM